MIKLCGLESIYFVLADYTTAAITSFWKGWNISNILFIYVILLKKANKW